MVGIPVVGIEDWNPAGYFYNAARIIYTSQLKEIKNELHGTRQTKDPIEQAFAFAAQLMPIACLKSDIIYCVKYSRQCVKY